MSYGDFILVSLVYYYYDPNLLKLGVAVVKG